MLTGQSLVINAAIEHFSKNAALERELPYPGLCILPHPVPGQLKESNIHAEVNAPLYASHPRSTFPATRRLQGIADGLTADGQLEMAVAITLPILTLHDNPDAANLNACDNLWGIAVTELIRPASLKLVISKEGCGKNIFLLVSLYLWTTPGRPQFTEDGDPYPGKDGALLWAMGVETSQREEVISGFKRWIRGDIESVNSEISYCSLAI